MINIILNELKGGDENDEPVHSSKERRNSGQVIID